MAQRLAEQRGDLYQTIFEFLRGVIADKENKANQVKEELVH